MGIGVTVCHGQDLNLTVASDPVGHPSFLKTQDCRAGS
jgi:hypothetical protein